MLTICENSLAFCLILGIYERLKIHKQDTKRGLRFIYVIPLTIS